MPHQPPPVIGITGPIAAGKSTLSERLGALGARVIDVDSLGHRALATHEVAEALRREFGNVSASAFLKADGSIDRPALARLAFADEAARRRLEAIVHPVVRREIDAAIRDAAGAPAVVVDCALLFESGLDALCDLTVAVDAPESLRFARARAAHGWDESDVRRRMAAQLSPAEKRSRADRVFENDENGPRLEAEARAILNEVVREGPAAATTRRSSP